MCLAYRWLGECSWSSGSRRALRQYTLESGISRDRGMRSFPRAHYSLVPGLLWARVVGETTRREPCAVDEASLCRRSRRVCDKEGQIEICFAQCMQRCDQVRGCRQVLTIAMVKTAEYTIVVLWYEACRRWVWLDCSQVMLVGISEPASQNSLATAGKKGWLRCATPSYCSSTI